MRYIKKKGYGGFHLEKANNNPPTISSQATSRWNSFSYKANVVIALKGAQYGLCAYSEIRPDLENLEFHIEHVEPKSLNPSRTFEFNNLVLSAISDQDLQGMDRVNVFGGHAKNSVYSSSLFVSCLQVNCPSYFAYLSNGRVEPMRKLSPHEKKKATYTINLLNLNCPHLIVLRKRWIDEMDQLIDEHIDKGMSLDYLAMVYLLPRNNMLDQFFTAARQRFSSIAENVLISNEPELM